MNAKQLIQILQTLDPDTIILVDGYEGGYTIPVETKQIEVCGPLIREWYYGEYDACKGKELFKTKAFLIPR